MRRNFIVLFFLILALALNIAGVRKSSVVTSIKSATAVILYPLEWFSSASINGLASSYSSLRSSKNLASKNKKLKQENNFLRLKLSQMKNLEEECRVLKKSLDFSASAFGLGKDDVLVAEVLGRNKDLWNSVLILNRGQADGVKTGMAVVVQDGLVGKIIEVTPLSSKVRLILDYNSAVVVRTLKSRVEALAIGRGNNLLDLEYVPSAADILVGEELVVSNSSQLIKGIPVGRIVEIESSELALFKKVKLYPLVDFSKLEIVYVVKR